MAKRKARKAPARRRSYAAPARRTTRRRSVSGTKYIPSVAMAAGLLYANKDVIGTVVNDMSINGVKNAAKQAIQQDTLKNDIVYGGGSFLAGAAFNKIAPSAIKTPVGQLAKKLHKYI